jgi:hypothetical protein
MILFRGNYNRLCSHPTASVLILRQAHATTGPRCLAESPVGRLLASTES